MCSILERCQTILLTGEVIMKNAEVAARNILLGNGGHGMKEGELVEALKNIKDLEKFLYTMSKCPKDYLTTHLISGEKPDIVEGWKGWFKIDERATTSHGDLKSRIRGVISMLFLKTDHLKKLALFLPT